MSTSASPLRRRLLWGVAVAAASFLAFLPALGAGFVNFDDETNFTKNPNYRGLGAETLRWMFSDHNGHYMPLTWLSLGVDYALWGMDGRGYHLSSLLIHVANALLFFLLLLRLLRRALPGDVEEAPLTAAAALGAGLFAVHPLRAESVAWITERRDVLSGFFFLLSLLAYLRAAEAEGGLRRRWLAASLGAFAASLLSKAMGMTLPFVLLVLDVYPLRRPGRETWRALLLEKAPYAALMLAGVALTSWAQRTAGAMADASLYPPLHSVIQPGHRTLFYVWKTLVPLNLSPLYYWHDGLHPLRPLYLLSLAVAAGVTLLLWRRRRSWPAACAAWLAFGFLIAPVAGIFQAGPHFAADRYSYLATLPFAVLAAGWLGRGGDVRRWAGAGLVALLGVLCFAQTRIWTDSLLLWNHVLRIDAEIPMAYYNRAGARLALNDMEGARADYEACLSRLPGHAKAIAGRGWLALQRGDVPGALKDLDAALTLDPSLVFVNFFRGVARLQAGAWREARADFDVVLKDKPGHAEALQYRANVRHTLQDHAGALADYDAAIAANPEIPDAYYNRALTKISLLDWEGAARDLDEAARRSPGDLGIRVRRAQAQRSRGDVLARAARTVESLQAWKAAEADLVEVLRAAAPGSPDRLLAEQEAAQVRARLAGR